MSLPTEILEAVVKLAREEDHDAAALKNMALASTTFRDICQPLLFQSVMLKNGPMAGYDKAEPPAFLVRFHDVVMQSPRIASYVQDLSIWQCSLPPFGRIVDREPPVVMMWMLDHPGLLTRILDALATTRIHAVSVASRRQVSWTDLDLGLQRSFFRIFQNPSFRNISLDGISIPSYFFTNFHTLQSVGVLNSLFLPRTASSSMPSNTTTHQISHLTFRVYPDANQYPTPHAMGPIIGIDVSRLTSLDLDLHIAQLPHLAHFNFFQLKYLTDLRVALSNRAPSPTLDFSGLPKLRRLTLGDNGFDTSSERIARALATISTTQCQTLERISVQALISSAGLKDIYSFSFLTPLAQSLSFLHRQSNNLHSVFHMKVYLGDRDDAQNRNVKAAILKFLKWEGCEGVLDVQMERSLEWFHRNRPSAW
ncbi:hypothetical protein BDN72DRAFT_963165 [Pluteus cervinus]|uniref:Uncharacterized protein n=1 Tax=Pluteus cervinus TaxID=181527 RepID=A0ACD3AFI3_9AGAR|nr:hypothetical protein BDN72DRAFT_963165 [Pluteus cervinus]